MKIIDYTMDCTNEYRIQGYLSHCYNPEKLLFFDIETTGFIAKNTTLYLIGVLWQECNLIHIRQWFNEDGKSEKELLTDFLSFCNNFTHLVHFNGIGFDLPYLKQKAELLQLDFDLQNTMKQIDIYKEIRPFRNIFHLENMKQVSIEQYLNLSREDTYSGKELIQIYQHYVAQPTEHYEQLLLLHNHDDLLGMLPVSMILNYHHFITKCVPENIDIQITTDTLEIHFNLNESLTLPRRLSTVKDGVYLNAIDNTAYIQLSIQKDTLKHFFTDYKNYYYLPLEDTAVHKSIAQYVDSNHRQKATKQTCYIKRHDSYIPCMDCNTTDVFKKNYIDKACYQTIHSLTEGDLETQQKYIQKILQNFL